MLELVKTGRHRTVYRLELPDDPSGTSLYIKRYRAADWKARWRRLARGATSRREYRGMVAVADLGVPTAQVVAIGGPLWPGHDRDSWLVTVGVPESRPLDELLSDNDPAIGPALRREVVSQVAEILARLHDGGIWHGDLHAGNFLVQSWDGERPRVVLIDLHPLLRYRPTTARRLKGLARLASAFGSSVTPSERWVFLQKYMEASAAVAFDEVTRREWAASWRPMFCRRRERMWRRMDRHWARGNRRLLIADSAEATCRGLVFLGGAVMTSMLRVDRAANGGSARDAGELGHALWRRGLPVARPWLYVETSRHGVLVVPVPDQAVPLAEWPDHESVEREVGILRDRIVRSGVSIDDLGSDQVLVDPENRDRPLLLLPTWTGKPVRPASPKVGPRAAMWLAAVSLAVAGCLSNTRNVAEPPVRHSVQAERFTLLSDVPLKKDHWLIDDLERLERHIVSGLSLPEPSREVVVHVFASRREYESFLASSYPQLPSRRAYFVGTPRRLAVYTFWGDRIQEDLRHEFTHGILHSSLKRVPLWLDEGLAEYFEVVGPKPGGVNTEYSDRLAAAVANGWQPDLERLEQLEHVADMQRVDYEQAWAWVHFLLHGHPRGPEVLRRYLGNLAERPYAGLLGPRIEESIPDADRLLLAYVRKLPTLGPGKTHSSRFRCLSPIDDVPWQQPPDRPRSPTYMPACDIDDSKTSSSFVCSCQYGRSHAPGPRFAIRALSSLNPSLA